MTLNLLFSYAFWNGPKMRECIRTLDRSIVDRVMVDSGAFTAHSRGDEVTLPGYFDFLDYLGDQVDQFIGLDVIANPEATMKNHLATLREGRHPIPVVTPGATENDIAAYAEMGYIAFGGLVNMSRPQQRRYLSRLMPNLPDGCKVHLLGTSEHRQIHVLRPTSVDSSSFTSGGRYGSGIFFLGDRLFTYAKFRKTPPRSRVLRRKLSRALEAHGYDSWEEVFEDREAFYTVAIRAHILYNQYIEREYGTLIYLAMSGEHWVRRVLSSYAFLRDKGLLEGSE